MTSGEPITSIVDSHVHYWDLGVPSFHYEWLNDGPDGLLGSLDELKIPLWDAERFSREIRHQPVVGVVHVQATTPPGDPVEETRWLAEQNRRSAAPHAIVARADLCDPQLDAVLDAHLEASELVRGIRDMNPSGRPQELLDGQGLGALEQRNLSWDAHCFWPDFSDLLECARRHPGLSIALGHAGFPIERSPGYFDAWRKQLRQLAAAENVSCKVSGLGMGDHMWTTDSMRPWVDSCLETFGAGRCLFGSNWPVDRLYGSYDATIAAYTDLVAEYSLSERTAFWHMNASQFYRLP